MVISLGVLGSGYCIYFDQRRRQDPEYKKKVKVRRLKAVESKESALSGVTKISDLKDIEAVRMFYQHCWLYECGCCMIEWVIVV